jgi:hypothetical protein
MTKNASEEEEEEELSGFFTMADHTADFSVKLLSIGR